MRLLTIILEARNLQDLITINIWIVHNLCFSISQLKVYDNAILLAYFIFFKQIYLTMLKNISKIIFLIFFLFLFVNVSAIQDSVPKQIPIMMLKNKQIKTLIDSLVINTKGTDRSNVILLSVCKFDRCQFLFVGCVNKGTACYLITETEFQSQPIVGFLKISNYDCYIFGDPSIKRFFRQTKDSILIPKKLEWLSEVSSIRYMDDLFNHIDTHFSDIPLYVTFDIQRYVYRKSKFEVLWPNSKFEDIFLDFKSSNRLPYRNYPPISNP